MKLTDLCKILRIIFRGLPRIPFYLLILMISTNGCGHKIDSPVSHDLLYEIQNLYYNAIVSDAIALTTMPIAIDQDSKNVIHFTYLDAGGQIGIALPYQTIDDTSRCEIHIFKEYLKLTYEYKRAALAHEIMHCLGMLHVDDHDSIMQPYHEMMSLQPSEQELYALHTLYSSGGFIDAQDSDRFLKTPLGNPSRLRQLSFAIRFN